MAAHDAVEPSTAVSVQLSVFPPKALPAFLLRASPAMMQGVLAGRAAGLEAFVSELIERARSNEASGLGEWLQHWLRSSADGGTMVTREEVVA